MFSECDRLTMLLQQIKEKLDQFNDEQLNQIADFIDSIEAQAQRLPGQNRKLWQNTTPTERAQEFRDWVSGLARTNISLPDEAFNRDSLYEG
ncbi:hypothetical protein [Roseofilum sp. SID1]|uniref:hypothetical protein n=1 Tax=Roseofilum sp. SID1 TaxID=2821497 RepID=UPI00298DE412|nr:hypothetical protein [Roseofilum sp. SID1]